MAYSIVSEESAVQAAFSHEDKFLQEAQQYAKLVRHFWDLNSGHNQAELHKGRYKP